VSIAERQGRSHARALGHALLALALIVGPNLAPADTALAARKKATPPSIAAAIVVDMNSGSILQEQAADTPRHPASLTKMMTLYVLFGYLKARSRRW
jgi:D-alanyl-D-alanine carboxypeptidase